jgi:hypothetical protein
MARNHARPPWEFLLSASRNSLQSYELSRLAHASNLRKEAGPILDQSKPVHNMTASPIGARSTTLASRLLSHQLCMGYGKQRNVRLKNTNRRVSIAPIYF